MRPMLSFLLRPIGFLPFLVLHVDALLAILKERYSVGPSCSFSLRRLSLKPSCLTYFKKSDVSGRTSSQMATDSGSEEESASIDQYVKYLHGGKYQFDDPSAVGAGMSSVGRAFAESLYSGSSNSLFQEAEDEDEEMIPNWAKQMRPPHDENGATVLEVSPGDQTRVQIVNQERTWERFYAFAMHEEENEQENREEECPFVVQPCKGRLAPRGGANNACDESRPYPDSAEITVRCVDSLCQSDKWWLIAGTEEEKWFFKLRLVF